MVVTRKKTFYEQLDTEQKVPPLLTVQVWDNDLFSRDDFLGTLNLNLAQLLRPTAKPAKCFLQPPAAIRRDQYLNLFREEKIRGWYPIVGKVNDRLIQTVNQSSARVGEVLFHCGSFRAGKNRAGASDPNRGGGSIETSWQRTKTATEASSS